jgi:hypothetical protein
MTKRAAVIILATLLLLTLAGPQLFKQANANPYRHVEHITDVPPPAGAQAQTLSILTPQNGSFYPSNVVPLTFNITVPNRAKSIGHIDRLYYEASWESNPTVLSGGFVFNTSSSIDLFVPGGCNHSLTIYAVGSGRYLNSTIISGNIANDYIDRFEIVVSSTVTFSQDFVPPTIAVLSPQNWSYDTSEVQLNVTSNEALSQILYCLDGNQNQTATGNTTIAGLENGAHNITVYATDFAGNQATPKTISFTVAKPDPFPIETLVIVVGVAAIIVGATVTLLLYRRHRKTTLPV